MKYWSIRRNCPRKGRWSNIKLFWVQSNAKLENRVSNSHYFKANLRDVVIKLRYENSLNSKVHTCTCLVMEKLDPWLIYRQKFIHRLGDLPMSILVFKLSWPNWALSLLSSSISSLQFLKFVWTLLSASIIRLGSSFSALVMIFL